MFQKGTKNKMATTSSVDMKLEECVIVYNPTETDSDKIATKLSATMSEVTQDPSPANAVASASQVATKVTKVSITSPAEERRRARRTCNSGSSRRVATLFVITEDILLDEARIFLDDMVKAATSSKTAKIVTVYYQVPQQSIPQMLRQHDVLDYEATDFKPELVKIIRGGYSKVLARSNC